jgi:hypothetical protein
MGAGYRQPSRKALAGANVQLGYTHRACARTGMAARQPIEEKRERCQIQLHPSAGRRDLEPDTK